MVASLLKKCALAALLASGMTSQASAQIEMATDPLQQVLQVIGITQKPKEGIEYRERPSLVVPPNTNALPPPSADVAARDPRWPQDPDVLARRRAAEEAKKPVSRSVTEKNHGERIGIEARGKYRNDYGGVPTDGTHSFNRTDRDIVVIPQDQLRRLREDARNETKLAPGQEPQREFLTDPPKGYRQSAAGAPMKSTVEPMSNINGKPIVNILTGAY